MRIMTTVFIAVLLGVGTPAAALITGSSTASNCGEGGNWIDITFSTDEGVTLVDAWWDFNGTGVWLDADGTSQCGMQNDGVTSFSFYFDVPSGTNTQDFGLTATGFDSDDYFRFVMDLDMGSSGMPYGADYMGGTVTVEFSDATVLVATFDTLYDGSNGATANFTNLGALPNFEFTVKPGWAGALVPREAADATWTSVPAPLLLTGETDATWLNAVYQNTGSVMAGTSRMNLHLDGAFLGFRNLWTIEPGAWNGSTNIGAYNVPGGRHVLRVTADAANNVTESDESDNVLAVQYCWRGADLAPLATLTRPAPPLYNQDHEYVTLNWHNCDGVRITPDPGYDWVSVWGEREADDGFISNYLRLHPAMDDPLDAFGTNLEISRGGADLQALLVNTHTAGSGPWDIGIIRFSANTPDYRIAHLHESPYPFDFGIEPETPYYVQRLAMFQFHVGTGDLGPATLTLYSDPDDGPVRMGWLAPDFTYGNLDDLNDAVVTDAEGCTQIDLDLTTTGDYCAVVYCNRAEHPGSLAVNVGLYGPTPDLENMTMTGWHAPMVPQPHDTSALFNCPLPDTLHGGVAATWMNLACRNGGTADADIVGWGMDVDGYWEYGIRQFTTLGPGGSRVLQNLEKAGEPWTFRGGRHTLGIRMDYLEELAESVERNNDSGRQYCWSPPVLPTNGRVTVEDSRAVPDREGGWDLCDGGETLYWNCDGWRMSYIPPIGSNRWWYATAVMPWANSLDIDLQLHAPLDGTQDGFGPDVLAESFSGDGQVEFVLVNDRYADNRPHDVGVLDDVDNYMPGYHIQEVRSAWGGIPGRGELGPYKMGAGRMLDLHEYILDPGDWLITLADNGSGVDWGMSLYQDGTYHGKAGVVNDAMAWQEGDGVTERMHVNVPAGTSFCLAVWKVDAGELDKEGNYSLWLAPGVSGTGEPAPALPQISRITGAAPNPFNPRTTIEFELKRDGPCHLALYDLQGRLVRTLVAEQRQAGLNATVWNGLDDRGRQAASGVYLARLRAGTETDLLKVTLLK